MSVAQQLLLRALVARFWRDAVRHAAHPLGHRAARPLHAAVLRPARLRRCRRGDAAARISDRSGVVRARISSSDFRWPARSPTRGVHLTLRQALEPWHVLGEEGTAGGTVRYVDSSVERLQVLVTGLTPDRTLVACNGRALPLQPTGRNGEYVAGVRYRAWQPPSGLHPTIPVHAPLTFDIVDTWMRPFARRLSVPRDASRRPELRAFPVNSYEAESRRLARFFPIGHTPGTRPVAPAERSREFPYTLDLRT